MKVAGYRFCFRTPARWFFTFRKLSFEVVMLLALWVETSDKTSSNVRWMVGLEVQVSADARWLPVHDDVEGAILLPL